MAGVQVDVHRQYREPSCKRNAPQKRDKDKRQCSRRKRDVREEAGMKRKKKRKKNSETVATMMKTKKADRRASKYNQYHYVTTAMKDGYTKGFFFGFGFGFDVELAASLGVSPSAFDVDLISLRWSGVSSASAQSWRFAVQHALRLGGHGELGRHEHVGGEECNVGRRRALISSCGDGAILERTTTECAFFGKPTPREQAAAFSQGPPIGRKQRSARLEIVHAPILLRPQHLPIVIQPRDAAVLKFVVAQAGSILKEKENFAPVPV
ncbi:hypothetical protein K438DRAFT_1777823 [Mycena galopus ATCC 62051]|nr:hypothetical protein K438DRAFT_1777823 [Mycena galopus ATCC 62051]